MNERINTIRALLSNPPSPESWEALFRELIHWPEKDISESLAYIEAHLKDWPDSLRVLPHHDYLQKEMPSLVRVHSPRQRRWKRYIHETLSHMPNLRQLELRERHLTPEFLLSLARDTEFKNLQWLDIEKNQELDEATLAALLQTSWGNHLQHLCLGRGEVKSAGFLRHQQKLEFLRLNDYPQLKSLKVLENCPRLCSLDLESCPQLELGTVSLPSLKSLRLQKSRLKSIHDLLDAPNLEELTLNKMTQLESLEGLARYPKLERVHLSNFHTKAIGLEPLRKLKNLKQVTWQPYLFQQITRDMLDPISHIEELTIVGYWQLNQIHFPVMSNLRSLHFPTRMELKRMTGLDKLPVLEELKIDRLWMGEQCFDRRHVNKRQNLTHLLEQLESASNRSKGLFDMLFGK